MHDTRVTEDLAPLPFSVATLSHRLMAKLGG